MISSAKIIALLTLAHLLAACSSQKLNTTGTPAVKHHTQTQTGSPNYYVPLPKMPGQWTVGDVLQTYGKKVTDKLNYYFAKAKVTYPPREVTFVALKQEKKLELWARNGGEFRFIRDYFILGASGEAGPKLRQGDRQVPEGIYRIVRLNPNSNYFLSMKINYPNEYDFFHAEQDGRTDLGSDIFIHGKTASIGCLAIGDEAIKELFVLTAQIGPENVKVVIAPHDPRTYPLIADNEVQPEWTSELYSIISNEIKPLTQKSKIGKYRFI
ncbi:MAG: L,D-transpeptidase family protein [Methylococcaceae bacterium]|nr:L,D-transpeptidase family protein [Methylococcaceae bacterium]